MGLDDGRLKALAEQFVVDCAALPPDVLRELANLCDGKTEGETESESIRAHLSTTPRRIRVMLPVAMSHFPYYKAVEPIDILGARLLHARFMQEILDLLGEARMHMYLLYLKDRQETTEGVPSRFLDLGRNVKVCPLPEQAKVDAFIAKLDTQRVFITDAMRDECSQRASRAEEELERARKREAAASAQKAAQERRLAEEHRRGKERAASDARRSAEDKFAAERSEWAKREVDLTATIEGLRRTLEEARSVAPSPGLTPADIDKLNSEVAREYQDAFEKWKDDTVRPWMERLSEAEKAYESALAASSLSGEVVELAEAEASKDLLSKWEAEPARALLLVEKRLKAVDELVAGTLNPSPRLQKLHGELRKALDGCRAHVERIEGYKPKTLMVGAIASTLAAMDYDSLTQVAASINLLAEKGALTDAEAEQISRLINDAVAFRKARDEHKKSPRSLLMGDLHSGKEVDVLIDAYNFMHLAKQHFGKMGRPGNRDPSRKTFGPDARAKLAEMVSVLHAKFPKSRVLLFLDGQNMEKEKPHPGVKFVRPTVQKEGEGQADAEIVHFIKTNPRSQASVYTVSSDRQVQAVSNRHLSVGVFCQFLIEL